VCSQSEKSNAISMAFETGSFKSISATTRADSISVDIPASGRMAVQYLKEYDGWCTQVTEKEIMDAQMSLVHDSGIFVEPASSAAWAAFVKDREMLEKRFGSDVSVCVLLTGIGFKDMAVFDGRVSMPESIENSVDAVIRRFS
ncbi:MAG: pyridoxal-phosphate dependent enzyme, partial [Spirochaetales bacterium]|nr:pyridoxal-phosphate dependent enzyme [Spirochaetales bacterium]